MEFTVQYTTVWSSLCSILQYGVHCAVYYSMEFTATTSLQPDKERQLIHSSEIELLEVLRGRVCALHVAHSPNQATNSVKSKWGVI